MLGSHARPQFAAYTFCDRKRRIEATGSSTDEIGVSHRDFVQAFIHADMLDEVYGTLPSRVEHLQLKLGGARFCRRVVRWFDSLRLCMDIGSPLSIGNCI